MMISRNILHILAFLITLLVISPLINGAPLNSSSIVFQNVGSVANMATGGAFLYTEGDTAGSIWNPATNLPSHISIYGSTTILYNNLVQYNHFAVSLNDESYPIPTPMALNCIFLKAGEMYNASAFSLSLILTLPNAGSIGFSTKIYKESVYETQYYAPGLDIGISFQPSKNVHLSIVGIDIGSICSQVVMRGVPLLRAGIDASMLLQEGDVNIDGALCIQFPYNNMQMSVLRSGVEIQILDFLFLRGGTILPIHEVQDTKITGGVGITFSDIKIDATYVFQRELGNSFSLSFSTQF